MSEAPAIGIDFGTANCIVAVFRNGRVEIMENLSYGDKLTPSFVTILQNNMNLIGQTSKNASAKYPGNTICGKVEMLWLPTLN